MDHAIEISALTPKAQRICRNLRFEESQHSYAPHIVNAAQKKGWEKGLGSSDLESVSLMIP